jgi:hypothetical protein
VAKSKNDSIDGAGATTIAVSIAVEELVLDFDGA